VLCGTCEGIAWGRIRFSPGQGSAVYSPASERRHGDAAAGSGTRMALVTRIRHLSLVLAAVCALALPALAGERMTPGGPDDAQPKSRSIPSVDGSSPAASPGARAPRTSINPTDDVYAPKASASTPAPRGSDVTPAQGTARTPAPEPTVRKRESAASIGRTQRPAPARVKVSIRNLPATPGMGTLLRVGVTAGSEIS
jgi:hypothetical protein